MEIPATFNFLQIFLLPKSYLGLDQIHSPYGLPEKIIITLQHNRITSKYSIELKKLFVYVDRQSVF